MSRAETTALRSFTALCASIFAFTCLARFGIESVWDDSYIVSRYTDNWLASGRLSWNPGDGPTYGLTSLLYLLVVIPMRAIIPDNAALALSLSSLCCGLVACGLMVAVLRDLSRSDSRRDLTAGCLVAFILATSARPLSVHFTSGMDTMFGVAYLAVYLRLLERQERTEARTNGLATAIFGALAFLARPDLLIFTFAIPALLVLQAPGSIRPWSALRSFGVLFVVAAAQVCVTAWYFESPLPLPFHAKGLRLYGDSTYAVYAGVAIAQLIAFLRSYWFLALPIVVDMAAGPRRGWIDAPPKEKAVLAGTTLFVSYHAFFVLPIMYYDQRFYTPALPALLYLAVPAARRVIERWRAGPAQPKLGLAVATACLAVGSADLARSGLFAWRLWEAKDRSLSSRFSVVEHYRTGMPGRVWRGLDTVAALPDDVTIAATEVGFPALLNPRKRILDLGGLNHTEIALGRATPASVLRTTLPDVIYLPHPDYQEMNRDIRSDAEFSSLYEMSRDPASPPALDVAILRSSRHYPALKSLVTPP